MTGEISPKDRLFSHFEGEVRDRPPCFSAIGNFIYTGHEEHGYPFYSVFQDAEKAADALSTSTEYGYENVICPIDVNIVAEAFGAEPSFYTDKDPDKVLYPTIKTKLPKEPEEYGSIEAPEITEAGRIPYVIETLNLLKEKVDPGTSVGAFILGPFLTAGQMVELDELYKATVKNPDEVMEFLDTIKDFQIKYANWLEEEGADFISFRPMGSSQDTLGVRKFKKFAQPFTEEILDSIDAYKVLHICGLTDDMVDLMSDCGAHGISVDQKNDLAANREKLGEKPNLYGGLTPYELMVNGTPDEIKSKVKECYENGVDVPMSGCDLWPDAPRENMETLTKSIKEYGEELWIKKNK